MNEQLTSKRNILAIGVILVIVLGIFGLLGTLSTFKTIEDIHKGTSFTKTMFFVPLIFYPFVFYTIYYLLAFFPTITITKEGIMTSTAFKTVKYSWNDMKEIELTGKQFHRFLFVTMPVEATTIFLKDNSKVFLWVDNYRNKSDLRIVLDRADKILSSNGQFSNLNFVIKRRSFSELAVSDYDFEEFNGNHVLNGNGLIFYSWIIFITVIVSLRPHVFLTNIGAILSMSLQRL